MMLSRLLLIVISIAAAALIAGGGWVAVRTSDSVLPPESNLIAPEESLSEVEVLPIDGVSAVDPEIESQQQEEDEEEILIEESEAALESANPNLEANLRTEEFSQTIDSKTCEIACDCSGFSGQELTDCTEGCAICEDIVR